MQLLPYPPLPELEAEVAVVDVAMRVASEFGLQLVVIACLGCLFVFVFFGYLRSGDDGGCSES